MKKRIKNILIIVLSVLVAASIGLNVYLVTTNTCNSTKQTTQTQNSNMPPAPPDGNNSQSGNEQGGPGSDQSSSVNATGKTTVKNTKTISEKTLSSTKSDESVVLTKSSGKLTLKNVKVNKSGDSSNTENSEFYGVNAGLLTTKGGTTTIKDSEVSTSAKGANAVFATGENAKVYIQNTTINTTGERSARGLDATYGGYIEADNVTINTKGGSCAALATDRGEGTVRVYNSNLTTNGAGSPVIYSTGNISIDKTNGQANGAQISVIEGKNKATITNSKVTCSATGNRGTTDMCGVMIYQSMSGDASKGTGTFTAKNSTLSINTNSKLYKKAPMFFITNTDAVINLNNTKLNFGSGTLIDAKGTSEWGNSGNNAGNVTLNATNQTLKGKIKADKISEVSINLKSSKYNGAINTNNKAKKVTLTLDKNSKLKLTGDTYVTSLNNSDKTNSNIDLNGYKLYVNGKAIK